MPTPDDLNRKKIICTLRASGYDLETLSTAASLAGKSLNRFVLEAALEQANDLVFSPRDDAPITRIDGDRP